MVSCHCRMPRTESLTEQPMERREKCFLSFSFEEMVEEVETEEETGPSRFSEDKDGPNTARSPPTLQLSRKKSCGACIERILQPTRKTLAHPWYYYSNHNSQKFKHFNA